MEFETNFKDDFPYYSNISLENNPTKLDSSNLMGNSNANNSQDFLNNHPFTIPFPSHPHQHYQDAYFHARGHGHGHHPVGNHHHGIFPTDLNIVPPFVMPDNNTIAAGYHLGANNHEHRQVSYQYHHHDPCSHGDEPMIPLEQILAFHDLNNMPREGTGFFESPIVDADERKGKKKVVAQPEGEAVLEISKAPNETSEVKGQWNPEEDRQLIQLVERYGVKRWSQVAKELGRRVGKQCRERWHNHLRPDIRKDVWSLEEDMILIKAHREFGNKWCKIAKRLPGRSENTIKNHWNATKRKQSFVGRTKPGGSSDGSGSTILQDYINSTVPPSSLVNKKKEKKIRSKRNNNNESANHELAAAANNISRNINNLESSHQTPYRFL